MELDLIECMLKDDEILSLIDEVIVLATLLDYHIKCEKFDYYEWTDKKYDADNENGWAWQISIRKGDRKAEFLVDYIDDKFNRITLWLNKDMINTLNRDEMVSYGNKLKEWL